MSGQGLVSIGVEAGTEQQAGQAAGLSPKHHWPPAAPPKGEEGEASTAAGQNRPQPIESRAACQPWIKGPWMPLRSRPKLTRSGPLGIDALRQRWRLMFGATPPKGLTKDIIARMIASRIQGEAFGGLDRETVRLLDRLARGGTPDGLNRRLKSPAPSSCASIGRTPHR